MIEFLQWVSPRWHVWIILFVLCIVVYGIGLGIVEWLRRRNQSKKGEVEIYGRALTYSEIQSLYKKQQWLRRKKE